MTVIDRTEREELFNYDVLVSCPSFFNLSFFLPTGGTTVSTSEDRIFEVTFNDGKRSHSVFLTHLHFRHSASSHRKPSAVHEDLAAPESLTLTLTLCLILTAAILTCAVYPAVRVSLVLGSAVAVAKHRHDYIRTDSGIVPGGIVPLPGDSAALDSERRKNCQLDVDGGSSFGCDDIPLTKTNYSPNLLNIYDRPRSMELLIPKDLANQAVDEWKESSTTGGGSMENHSDCSRSTEIEKQRDGRSAEIQQSVFVDGKTTDSAAVDQRVETKTKQRLSSTQPVPPYLLLICYVVLRVTCAVTLTFTVAASVACYCLDDGFESDFSAVLSSMHRGVRLDRLAGRHIEQEVLRQTVEVRESQSACETYVHDLIGIVHRRLSPDVDARRNSGLWRDTNDSRQVLTRYSTSLVTFKSFVTNFTHAYRAKVEDAIRPWFRLCHSYLVRIFRNAWLLFPGGLFNRTGAGMIGGFGSDPEGSKFSGVEVGFGLFLNVQEVEVVQEWERKFWERYSRASDINWLGPLRVRG